MCQMCVKLSWCIPVCFLCTGVWGCVQQRQNASLPHSCSGESVIWIFVSPHRPQSWLLVWKNYFLQSVWLIKNIRGKRQPTFFHGRIKTDGGFWVRYITLNYRNSRKIQIFQKFKIPKQNIFLIAQFYSLCNQRKITFIC